MVDIYLTLTMLFLHGTRGEKERRNTEKLFNIDLAIEKKELFKVSLIESRCDQFFHVEILMIK